MSRPASRPFWLLARPDTGRADVLTAYLSGGEKALPVFSFADEARMFLDLGTARDGWRVRETPVEELLAMLLDPRAEIGMVLLDPLPGLGGRAAADLVGVPREAFMVHQLNRLMHPGSTRERSASATRVPAETAV